MKPRARLDSGRWVAEHPSCDFTRHLPTVQAAYREARLHRCLSMLGPKPLPPDVEIVGTGDVQREYIEAPQSWHGLEVWW